MDEVLTVDGWQGPRSWRRIGETSHVNRDGRQTRLAEWEGACTICGEPFRVTAPFGAHTIEQSKSFAAATCPKHRMTPSETAKIRFAKKDRRADVFEAIKRKKLAAQEAAP